MTVHASCIPTAKRVCGTRGGNVFAASQREVRGVPLRAAPPGGQLAIVEPSKSALFVSKDEISHMEAHPKSEELLILHRGITQLTFDNGRCNATSFYYDSAYGVLRHACYSPTWSGFLLSSNGLRVYNRNEKKPAAVILPERQMKLARFLGHTDNLVGALDVDGFLHVYDLRVHSTPLVKAKKLHVSGQCSFDVKSPDVLVSAGADKTVREWALTATTDVVETRRVASRVSLTQVRQHAVQYEFTNALFSESKELCALWQTSVSKSIFTVVRFHQTEMTHVDVTHDVQCKLGKEDIFQPQAINWMKNDGLDTMLLLGEHKGASSLGSHSLLIRMPFEPDRYSHSVSPATVVRCEPWSTLQKECPECSVKLRHGAYYVELTLVLSPYSIYLAGLPLQAIFATDGQFVVTVSVKVCLPSNYPSAPPSLTVESARCEPPGVELSQSYLFTLQKMFSAHRCKIEEEQANPAYPLHSMFRGLQTTLEKYERNMSPPKTAMNIDLATEYKLVGDLEDVFVHNLKVAQKMKNVNAVGTWAVLISLLENPVSVVKRAAIRSAVLALLKAEDCVTVAAVACACDWRSQKDLFLVHPRTRPTAQKERERSISETSVVKSEMAKAMTPSMLFTPDEKSAIVEETATSSQEFQRSTEREKESGRREAIRFGSTRVATPKAIACSDLLRTPRCGTPMSHDSPKLLFERLPESPDDYFVVDLPMLFEGNMGPFTLAQRIVIKALDGEKLHLPSTLIRKFVFRKEDAVQPLKMRYTPKSSFVFDWQLATVNERILPFLDFPTGKEEYREKGEELRKAMAAAKRESAQGVFSKLMSPAKEKSAFQKPCIPVASEYDSLRLDPPKSSALQCNASAPQEQWFCCITGKPLKGVALLCNSCGCVFEYEEAKAWFSADRNCPSGCDCKCSFGCPIWKVA